MSDQKISSDGQEYAALFLVKDLNKQVDFYTETIGLQLQWRKDNEAGLGGCSTNLLLLREGEIKAANEPLTIKLPSRRELAIVIGRLCTVRYPNKPLDHTIKHSAHITDPEGNAVEIFVDQCQPS